MKRTSDVVLLYGDRNLFPGQPHDLPDAIPDIGSIESRAVIGMLTGAAKSAGLWVGLSVDRAIEDAHQRLENLKRVNAAIDRNTDRVMALQRAETERAVCQLLTLGLYGFLVPRPAAQLEPIPRLDLPREFDGEMITPLHIEHGLDTLRWAKYVKIDRGIASVTPLLVDELLWWHRLAA